MTDVVAALIWDGDRFLACQRPAHKSHGLLWEFVGGKVEPGESPQEALIRECREELNVTVAPQDVFMEVIHEYPDITIRLILFNASIEQGTPQKLEHNDIRWIKTSEIPDMTFCPADKDILAVLQNIDNSLQAKLYAHRDETYRNFHASLLPGIDINRILGVRMPVLRKLAKKIDLQALGCHLPHRYYEEDCLHGLWINGIADYSDAVKALDEFLPHVDNWAVCDLLSPKAFQNCPEGLMAQVRIWLQNEHTYTVRFAIGVLMKYYLADHFSPTHFDLVAGCCCEDYYVNMMVAWYFATALATVYDDTLAYLKQHRLSPWCHNKSIQKAIESYRITPEQKTYLKTLKFSKEVLP